LSRTHVGVLQSAVGALTYPGERAANRSTAHRMRRVVGDVLGVVVVTWDREAWVPLSRVRLCGRTVESVLKESQIHGKTTPRISSEKKTRIVLSVIVGEMTIAEAARREMISEQSIGRWKADFLEAGKTALAAGKSGPSTREEQL